MPDREPLEHGNGKSELFDLPPPPKEAPAKKEQQQQQITVDNINGRLAELAEQNQTLTGRCALLRGEIADRDRIIADLRAQLIASTGDKKSSLRRR